jgi:hypothetical protein
MNPALLSPQQRSLEEQKKTIIVVPDSWLRRIATLATEGVWTFMALKRAGLYLAEPQAIFLAPENGLCIMQSKKHRTESPTFIKHLSYRF